VAAFDRAQTTREEVVSAILAVCEESPRVAVSA